MNEARTRRIIHIDMDAFYASVEQRDRPETAGQPVIVAKRSPRAVVTAASYEAREFGIRSAMPAMRAANLCPHAVFIAPDFDRYRNVSRQIRAIMERVTAIIQPLSLDEAYLDVSQITDDSHPASRIARNLRTAIASETGLAASAGIAPNKFIAKIASDWHKPNGQYVVPPEHVDTFLRPLPVGKIPGVGPTMRTRLAAMNVATIDDLREIEVSTLTHHFGQWGQRLHELAHGRDDRPVEPNRPEKQISAEDTLSEDASLDDLGPHIQRLAARVWDRYQRKQPGRPRTVTLKLKTTNFEIRTRAYTPPSPPASSDEIASIASALRYRTVMDSNTRYRLVGIGISGFMRGDDHPEQISLFPI